jgi:GNAT superfamily N-acetyltransferase
MGRAGVIRRATLDDAATVEAIAARCYPHSHWVGVAAYEPDVALKSIRALIGSDQAVVLFSDDGALAALKCPLWFTSEPAIAEYFFWSLDGSGARLRAAAEAWAKDQGVRIVLMGSHEPGPTARIENWYRRGGYVPHGRTYRKVLNHGH